MRKTRKTIDCLLCSSLTGAGGGTLIRRNGRRSVGSSFPRILSSRLHSCAVTSDPSDPVISFLFWAFIIPKRGGRLCLFSSLSIRQHFWCLTFARILITAPISKPSRHHRQPHNTNQCKSELRSAALWPFGLFPSCCLRGGGERSVGAVDTAL